MRDDYGNTLNAGDRLSLSVGIPPREVIVTIKSRRGLLLRKRQARKGLGAA